VTREARDTLWLLASLAWVLAPHASRLPLWCSAGAALALLWRAQLAWRNAPLPSRWWLALWLLCAVALTRLQYASLLGRESGIALVVILTALKSLELRARRDALVCMYLGFFLIFTQFLYSQGLGTALLMLVGVWALLTSLVLGQRPLGTPPFKEVGKEAGLAMVRGLPLMVLLFVLFPRLGPLWSSPSDTPHRTGLSESVTLGQVADLAQDESIALRLTFTGAPPSASQMYFRGPTLDDFDGRTWRAAPPAQQRESIELQGPSILYELTLEPSPLNVVPLLEGTGQAMVRLPEHGVSLSHSGLQWQHSAQKDQRLVVQARAWPQATHGRDTDRVRLRRWEALPARLNPRTMAWAAELHAQPAYREADARTLAMAVLNHIRHENYRYSLQPGLPANPDTEDLIDDFWLDRRVGFCEHFATAFVVVMRAMDVPARVVTGYQGAEYNAVDGQYVVRNSQAHAWAEIWSEGQGWVRVDPTAAVAPERVEQAPRPRPVALLPGGMGQVDAATLRRLRALWEAVDHRWNVWVLQYDRDSQVDVLKRLGWSSPNWQDIGQLLGALIGVLGLGSSLVLWLRREKNPQSEWHKPLRQLHQTLSRLGMNAPAGPTPAAASAWRAHLLHQWPAPSSRTQQALLDALRDLDALRYGPSLAPDANARQHRRQALRKIEQLSRALLASRAHSGLSQPSHSG
jgi:transglutaminase-like putative cysteine protease